MSGRVVAFDLGETRIGVAVSDPTGTIAEGRETIVQPGSSVPWRRVLAVVEAAEAVRVVVGVPVKLDGTLGKVDRARVLLSLPVSNGWLHVANRVLVPEKTLGL